MFFKHMRIYQNHSGESGHGLTNISVIIYYLTNAVIIFIGIVNIVVNMGLTNEIELATPLYIYIYIYMCTHSVSSK